jgi:hypothetical protein
VLLSPRLRRTLRASTRGSVGGCSASRTGLLVPVHDVPASRDAPPATARQPELPALPLCHRGTYTVGACISAYTSGRLLDAAGPRPVFALAAGGLALDGACALLLRERRAAPSSAKALAAAPATGAHGAAAVSAARGGGGSAAPVAPLQLPMHVVGADKQPAAVNVSARAGPPAVWAAGDPPAPQPAAATLHAAAPQNGSLADCGAARGGAEGKGGDEAAMRGRLPRQGGSPGLHVPSLRHWHQNVLMPVRCPRAQSRCWQGPRRALPRSRPPRALAGCRSARLMPPATPASRLRARARRRCRPATHTAQAPCCACCAPCGACCTVGTSTRPRCSSSHGGCGRRRSPHLVNLLGTGCPFITGCRPLLTCRALCRYALALPAGLPLAQLRALLLLHAVPAFQRGVPGAGVAAGQPHGRRG